MKRLQQKLQQDKNLLSIYFTAGFPKPEDTVTIIEELEKSGVDFLEIGLPFSDPLADGPVIQKSSQTALEHGMTTNKLFQQLENIRGKIEIPLIIMGYFNPILQYGVEEFCQKCQETGIDALIIPDLPVEVYQEQYQSVFEKYDLPLIFLVTPQTSEARIRFIDSCSKAFIYMVSSNAVTGGKKSFGEAQENYFQRMAAMDLKSPLVIGFGIHDAESFQQATGYAKGAIIGSAFIKTLTKNGISGISEFILKIKEKNQL